LQDIRIFTITGEEACDYNNLNNLIVIQAGGIVIKKSEMELKSVISYGE
jgi:hypothetical protein